MSMFIKLMILGVLFSASAFSLEDDTFMEESCQERLCSPRVEAKAGYFFFASRKMKEVYSNGGYEVQLSGSYPIKEGLHVYGSVGFIETKGKSLNFHEKTTFWQIPIDLGFKGIVCLASCADWYIAAGPRYFYAHQHNDSDFVDKNIGKRGIGLFANTGIDFFLSQNFYLNVFGEYSYQPTRSSREDVQIRDIQIGGFAFGAGIGYSF